jgi:DNA helicase-2/ATP-dependent DNA helicase PcrA
MSELNAQSILSALDEDQAQAAQALRGPVAIIAGPGSGKTRTVSHRIAYGITTGVFNPSKTLALTYTNRAAAELRLRLRQLGARSVQVRTFHSAALGQLQYFWPQITGFAAPKLLTSKRSLVAEAANELKLGLTEGKLQEAISEIEYLSYTMTQPEDFEGSSLAGKLPDLVARFRSLKAERRLIDWEDALLLCTGMLRNEPRIMAQFEQQYRHFTVDEYQDISPLQQALLETWLADRDEVCVVGDPRQTIYSFTGATSEFLLDFPARFESAAIFQLNKNYRSGQDIVACANGLLPESPLEPVKTTRGSVVFAEHPSAATEADAVVAEISRSSSPRAEIAILARTNSQLAGFEERLSAAGIPFQVRGQGRFFARPEIRHATMAVRALSLADSGQGLEIQLAEILRPLGWSASITQTEISKSLNWFFEVLEELGEPSLEDFLRELDERERSGHEPVQDAITLATIHGTKGLEWNEVYLVGVNDGLYPISHAKTDSEKAEERRLLYVAVTRAKQRLVISSLGSKPSSPFMKDLLGSHNP